MTTRVQIQVTRLTHRTVSVTLTLWDTSNGLCALRTVTKRGRTLSKALGEARIYWNMRRHATGWGSKPVDFGTESELQAAE